MKKIKEFNECELEVTIRLTYRVPAGEPVSSRNDHEYCMAVEKAVGKVKGIRRFQRAKSKLLSFTPAAIVLAWWFTFSAFHSRGVIGPFKTEKACETIRVNFDKKFAWGLGDYTDKCISDGES